MVDGGRFSHCCERLNKLAAERAGEGGTMKTRNGWSWAVLLVAELAGGCMGAGAQTPSVVPAVSTAAVDSLTADEIAAREKNLLSQATAAPGGIAGITLAKYSGHLTMLTVRVKSGGAEFHKKNNDIFVAVDGEATVITGGTLVDPQNSSADEIVGTRLEGGVAHVMHKGDIIHIPVNTPHQTVVAPGKTFTYYVVKVVEPAPR